RPAPSHTPSNWHCFRQFNFTGSLSVIWPASSDLWCWPVQRFLLLLFLWVLRGLEHDDCSIGSVADMGTVIGHCSDFCCSGYCAVYIHWHQVVGSVCFGSSNAICRSIACRRPRPHWVGRS